MADDLDTLASKFGGKPAGGEMDALAAKFGAISPQAVTKQNDLPIDWKGVVRTGAKALPAIGAAGAVMAGPAGWLPAIGMAALGGGAGAAAEQGVDAAIGDPVTLGSAAKEVGKEAIFNGLAEGGGRLVGSAIGRLAERFTPEALYQSALKPRGGGKDLGKVREIVQTGLSEKIPVSEAGLDRTSQIIDDLNGQISAGIQARKSMGLTVDPELVVRRIDEAAARYKDTTEYPDAVAAATKLKQRFYETAGIKRGTVEAAPTATDPYTVSVTQGSGPEAIPVDRAQRIKQMEGALVRKAYGKPNAEVSFDDEFRKQMVRGLKEEIESVFPEVKGLNDRERKLIGLERALQDFVKREGNHQRTGIGTPLMAIGAAAATGNPMVGLEAALLRGALEDPTIKSRLGMMIQSAQFIGRAKKATEKVINLPNAIRSAKTFGDMQQ